MNLSDDKIHSFLDACWNAGIKNPVAFLESKRPQVYDWLRDCFPRGILPTDIDGEVEIGGHFLRLEFKDDSALRNGYVPKGQRRALANLIQTNRFTVFIIGTNQLGEPTCCEIYSNKGHTKLRDASKDTIREWCKNWAEKAEKNQL